MFQNLPLKEGGRLRPAGLVVAALAVGCVASIGFASAVQWHTRRGLETFRQAELARFRGDRGGFDLAATAATAHLGWIARFGVFHTRGLGRMMGELHRWNGDTDAALGWYRADLDAASRNRELPMLVGLAHEQAGRPDEAAAWYDRSLDHPRTTRDRFLKLNWELRRTRSDTARRRVLERGLERFPADGDLALHLATLLVQSRDPTVRDRPRALAVAERAVGSGAADHAELLGLLAWLYDQDGRHREAYDTAVRSRDVAESTGRADLARDMAAMAEEYRGRLER
jgi:tetratricopeptide (TPR) repeat protein